MHFNLYCTSIVFGIVLNQVVIVILGEIIGVANVRHSDSDSYLTRRKHRGCQRSGCCIGTSHQRIVIVIVNTRFHSRLWYSALESDSVIEIEEKANMPKWLRNYVCFFKKKEKKCCVY